MMRQISQESVSPCWARLREGSPHPPSILCGPLFAFDPVRNVEIFYIEFDAGVRHESAAHVDGVEEYIFLLQGAMGLMTSGKEAVLQEKQSIRFRADVPHAYENLSQECCCVYNMIVYPNP